VAYIMDTFPIVRRKDEAAHGEYRTKRVILEICDEMAAAMGSRELGIGNRGEVPTPHSLLPTPYQTRLDPPPAHPDAAHPWDEAYLGPELPRDQWWEEEGSGELGIGNRVKEAPPTPYSPLPTPLELQPPPAPAPTAKPKPTLPAQPTLLTDFSPPQGSRTQRLKTVMGLGQPKNQAELQALVGALADEDSNIRWLAGSSLVRIRGLAVVNMLAAFLQSDPGDTACREAVKVLGLIADTDEDEGVRTAAREAML
jgi:hypothetical protein